MKYLVTGGAGFIGSNFIYHILAEHPEDRVVCLDKLTYAGNLVTLERAFADPRFSFVKGDICDKAAVDKLFAREKFDFAVNFAAESHVDRSISDPQIFLTTNVIGTQVLLDASLNYGVKRFHQISTDEVYGDLPTDSGAAFSEVSPLRASSPYSASKAAADLLVMAYCRTYGANVSISRSSNNYGAYQLPEKLIPLTIQRALAGESIPVYGDGLNVRDWLHVKDHCRAVDLILRRGRAGAIYNVGGGNELANIQIVRRVLSLLGCSESLITYVTDRKGHDRRYAVDCSKIRGELGWTPQTDFDAGLEKTVRWYVKNTKWLRAVSSKNC